MALTRDIGSGAHPDICGDPRKALRRSVLYNSPVSLGRNNCTTTLLKSWFLIVHSDRDTKPSIICIIIDFLPDATIEYPHNPFGVATKNLF
jgi:hypothetical protein